MFAFFKTFFILVAIGQILPFDLSVKANFPDNSEAGVALRAEALESKPRFRWRMNLLGWFDISYHTLCKMKNIVLLYEPLPIDYGLLLQAYEDSAPYPNLNPIDPNELHFHQLYFDSTAVLKKSAEHIFVDFFAKYSAALATLHFLVESFISKQLSVALVDSTAWGKNCTFGQEFDRLAYYTFWFFNLEIDRHMFDLQEIMREYNLEDPQIKNVIKAFKDIHMGMNDLVSLKLFIDKTLHLLKFGYKKNPFDVTLERDVFPTNGSWLLIIQYLIDMKLKAGTKINVDDFKHIISYEKVDTTVHTKYIHNPKKYAQYLYHNCWLAIDMFMGNQLYIMESFFYTTLIGDKYPRKKFGKPRFEFSEKLRRNFEKTFSKILKLNPEKPRRIFGDHGSKIYRSKIIEILRIVDYIRFGYILPENKNYQKNFFLQSCHKKWYEKPLICSGSFRLMEIKSGKRKNEEKYQEEEEKQQDDTDEKKKENQNDTEEVEKRNEHHEEEINEEQNNVGDEEYETEKNKT